MNAQVAKHISEHQADGEEAERMRAAEPLPLPQAHGHLRWAIRHPLRWIVSRWHVFWFKREYRAMRRALTEDCRAEGK